MKNLNDFFEKKILYTNLIGLLIVLLLLLSGKFYYYNDSGEIKFYTNYVSTFCGFISFLFFLKDNNFKFKYWIFMIISIYILSFLLGIFSGVLLALGYFNYILFIFFIFFMTNIIILPILYKIFKDISYKQILKNKKEI